MSLLIDTSHMIDEALQPQFMTGEDAEMRGITLHNTRSELSAVECIDSMTASSGTFAAHFFVDETGIYQALPLTQGCWHTGKGRDDGNLSTIAIEVCRSASAADVYELAEAHAFELIKHLLGEGQDYKSIYWHQRFNQRVYCPHRIMSRFANEADFVAHYLTKEL